MHGRTGARTSERSRMPCRPESSSYDSLHLHLHVHEARRGGRGESGHDELGQPRVCWRLHTCSLSSESSARSMAR